MTWTVRDSENGNEREFDSRSEAEDAKEDMEAMGVCVEIVGPNDGSAQAVPVVDDELTAMDPQDRLIDRDWMLTTIEYSNGDTSEDLNKRGAQVIAEVLGAYPDSELVTYAPEADPCYAIVKAWVTDPETGEMYSAHGEARSTEQNVGDHEVIRQAETRAKKRTIKWVSASGAKALLQAGEEVPDA
jgi:hypothetical protein